MNRLCTRSQFLLTASLFVLITFAYPLAVRTEEIATLNDGFKIAETDWPWWRGPSRNGVAASNQSPPLVWSSDRNIIWKAPLPGRGHGSPTLVGDKIFIQTADESNGAQMVLCLNRSTGEQLWRTVVHASGGRPATPNARLHLSPIFR